MHALFRLWGIVESLNPKQSRNVLVLHIANISFVLPLLPFIASKKSVDAPSWIKVLSIVIPHYYVRKMRNIEDKRICIRFESFTAAAHAYDGNSGVTCKAYIRHRISDHHSTLSRNMKFTQKIQCTFRIRFNRIYSVIGVYFFK